MGEWLISDISLLGVEIQTRVFVVSAIFLFTLGRWRSDRMRATQRIR